MSIRRSILVVLLSLLLLICSCSSPTPDLFVAKSNSSESRTVILSPSPTIETILEQDGGEETRSVFSEGEYKPQGQEASLAGVSGNAPEKEIMLAFDLEEEGEEPISTGDPPGAFQVTVNGAAFPCVRWDENPHRIYCISSLVKNNVIALVRLENLTSGAMLYAGEVSILILDQEQEVNQAKACTELDYQTCYARSDCKWISTKLPAGCEPR